MERKVGEHRRKKRANKKEQEKRNPDNTEEQSLTSGGEEKRSEKYIRHKIVTKCKAGEEEAPPLGQLAATV